MRGTVEQRRFRRVCVTLTAHCRIGHRYVRDAVSDLSLGGLFLKTREPVPQGAPVRLAVALPSGEGPSYCTLVGRVVRVDARGVGVAFEVGAGDGHALASFIAARASAAA